MPTALEWQEIIQSVADRTPTPGQEGLPPDISVPRGLTAGEDFWEGLKSGTTLGFMGRNVRETGWGTVGSIVGEILPFTAGGLVAAKILGRAAGLARTGLAQSGKKIVGKEVDDSTLSLLAKIGLKRTSGRETWRAARGARAIEGAAGTLPLEAIREANVYGEIDPLTLALTTAGGAAGFAYQPEITKGLKAIGRRIGLSKRKLPPEAQGRLPIGETETIPGPPDRMPEGAVPPPQATRAELEAMGQQTMPLETEFPRGGLGPFPRSAPDPNMIPPFSPKEAYAHQTVNMGRPFAAPLTSGMPPTPLLEAGTPPTGGVGWPPRAGGGVAPGGGQPAPFRGRVTLPESPSGPTSLVPHQPDLPATIAGSQGRLMGSAAMPPVPGAEIRPPSALRPLATGTRPPYTEIKDPGVRAKSDAAIAARGGPTAEEWKNLPEGQAIMEINAQSQVQADDALRSQAAAIDRGDPVVTASEEVKIPAKTKVPKEPDVTGEDLVDEMVDGDIWQPTGKRGTVTKAERAKAQERVNQRSESQSKKLKKGMGDAKLSGRERAAIKNFEKAVSDDVKFKPKKGAHRSPVIFSQRLQRLVDVEAAATREGNTVLANNARIMQHELIPDDFPPLDTITKEDFAALSSILPEEFQRRVLDQQELRKTVIDALNEAGTTIKAGDKTILLRALNQIENNLSILEAAYNSKNTTIAQIKHNGTFPGTNIYHMDAGHLDVIRMRAAGEELADVEKFMRLAKLPNLLQQSEDAVEAFLDQFPEGLRLWAMVLDPDRFPIGSPEYYEAISRLDFGKDQMAQLPKLTKKQIAAGIHKRPNQALREKLAKAQIDFEDTKLELAQAKEGMDPKDLWYTTPVEEENAFKAARLELKKIEAKVAAWEDFTQGKICYSDCANVIYGENNGVIDGIPPSARFDMLKAEVSKRMGFMSRVLPAVWAYGREMGVKVITPLQQVLLRQERVISRYHSRINTAMKKHGWTNTEENSTRLWELLGRHVKENGTLKVHVVTDKTTGRVVERVDASRVYSSSEIDFAKDMRKVFNEAGVEFDVDTSTYLDTYIPKISATMSQVLDEMALGNPLITGKMRKKIQLLAETHFNVEDSIKAKYLKGHALEGQVVDEGVLSQAMKEPSPEKYARDHNFGMEIVREVEYLGSPAHADLPEVKWAEEARLKSSNRLGTELGPGKIGQKNYEFFAKHHRLQGHKEFRPNKDALSLITQYIRAGARDKYLETEIKRLRPLIAKNFRGDGLQGDAFERYLNQLRGAPTQQEIAANRTLHGWGARIPGMGFLLQPRISQDMSGMITTLAYAGGLGLKVGSALKNLTQNVHTFAELGSKYTLKGIYDLINDPAAQKLAREANIYALAYEKVIGSETNFGHLAGKISAGAEKMLWMFVTADKINRGIGYLGARAKFIDYHAAGKLTSRGPEKWLGKGGALTPGGAAKSFRSLNIHEDLLPEIQNMLKAEGVEAAADMYAKDVVSRTQYIYGAANQPAFIASGPLGKMAGVFMTWPLNYVGLWRGWMRDRNIAAVTRIMMAHMAFMGTAGQVADVDITNWFGLGSMPSTPGQVIFGSAFHGAETIKGYSRIGMQQMMFGAYDPTLLYHAEIAKSKWRNSMSLFIPGGAAARAAYKGWTSEGSVGGRAFRAVSGVPLKPPQQ